MRSEPIERTAEVGAGAESPSLVRALSLRDSTLLIVGGVIGSAIFLTPGDVAREVASPASMLALWVFGGLVAMAGALSVAELAGMYPEAGGQYVYLREAYGDLPAFLFGWMMLLAGNGGGIATIATGFALYLGEVVPGLRADAVIASVGNWTLTRGHVVAIVAISLACLVGVVGVKRMAEWINATTWVKFAAMAAFIVLGLLVGRGDWSNLHEAAKAGTGGFRGINAGWGVALIAVFWAYDGWVYVFWMGGEIKQAASNIPRALVLGIAAITLIYVAMNVALLYAIPSSAMATNTTVAQTAAVKLFSPGAAKWLSLMIAVSCFGALLPNAGCAGRLIYAMSKDGLFFKKLSEVHPKWRTPALAVVTQSVVGALLVLTGGYEDLFTYTVFAMTLFYALTVAAVFVMRRRNPGMERPYRCLGYPLVPALYVLITVLWSVNAVVREPRMTLAGLGLILVGCPLYLFWKLRLQRPADRQQPGPHLA